MFNVFKSISLIKNTILRSFHVLNFDNLTAMENRQSWVFLYTPASFARASLLYPGLMTAGFTFKHSLFFNGFCTALIMFLAREGRHATISDSNIFYLRGVWGAPTFLWLQEITILSHQCFYWQLLKLPLLYLNCGIFYRTKKYLSALREEQKMSLKD